MQRVSLAELEPTAFGDGTRRQALADPLGATGVAVNRYRVPPSAGLPGGLHAHRDQEEVFVVLAGRATFETLDGPVTVAAGEAVRFAPGEFQSGRNRADEPLLVLAIGAPPDTEDVRLPFDCPDCGDGPLRLATGGGVAFVCPGCGAEHVPADCPTCGGAELQATLGEGDEPVVVCRDCEATFDEPPVEG